MLSQKATTNFVFGCIEPTLLHWQRKGERDRRKRRRRRARKEPGWSACAREHSVPSPSIKPSFWECPAELFRSAYKTQNGRIHQSLILETWKWILFVGLCVIWRLLWGGLFRSLVIQVDEEMATEEEEREDDNNTVGMGWWVEIQVLNWQGFWNCEN